jgi:hypothetical protein
MSIPKRTTLKQRLEFYEYALGEIENFRRFYVCAAGVYFYADARFLITDIKRLFPELYCLNSKDSKNSLFLWNNNSERIEALKQAIIDVKKKMK